MQKTLAAFALAIALGASAASAASFNCAKARSYSEKLICSDPQLSAADDDLARVYGAAKEKTGNSKQFRRFVEENWKRREQCADPACVRSWYQSSRAAYERIAGGAALPREAAAKKAPPCFVKGLKRCVTYRFKDAPGLQLNYSDGRRFKVSMYFDRTVEVAYYIDENNRRIGIPADFRPMFSEKDMAEQTNGREDYALGQYDFDGDGADEIVLAGRTWAPDGMNGLAVTVYRIRDGKTWSFGASDISGDPAARIGANKVFIPRNFRGFVHEWTFYRDAFQYEETN